jgi:GT2 family glycosyltransferase
MPSITAVIVVWNELADLQRCVEAIQRQDVELSIVIVDNGSTDGSLEWARSLPKELARVISTGEDLGFCKAVNIGFNDAESDFIVNVSPDVTLQDGYISHCLKVMQDQPAVGICAGKLLRSGEDGELIEPPRIDSSGHSPKRDGTVFEPAHGKLDLGQYDEPKEVLATNLAAALFRRAAVDDLRYEGQIFDEDFWGYKDDIDVCWRAWWLGWRVRYEPQAVAYHRRGFLHTDRKTQRRKTIPLVNRYNSFRNRYLLLIHNAHLRVVLRFSPWLLWYEIKALGFLLLFERDLLSSYISALRLAPRAIRLRRDLRRRSRAEFDPWVRFVE